MPSGGFRGFIPLPTEYPSAGIHRRSVEAMISTRARIGTRLLASTVLAAAGVVLGGCAQAPDRPQSASASPLPAGSVWIADEGGDALTVIDAAANAVAMTVNGIAGPHNVQVGRDGSVVYAVSRTGAVVAIDPGTYQLSASAPTGPQPAHVIEAPNAKVYVTNSGDGTVSVYQAPALTPVGKITLDGMPHGLRAAAGGSVIVVANTGNGALDLIDPNTDRFVGAVPVGATPAQVAVSADGKYAYTGISEPPSVVKVDLAQRKVVGSAPVPNSPVQLYLTPDETTVVCADQGRRDARGNTLSVIDSTAMTTRGTVITGAGPHGVVIDSSGQWAWVTNSYDNTVSTVDLGTLSALPAIAVGSRPNGISYSPRPPAQSATTTTTVTLPALSGEGSTSGHGHGH